MKKARSPADRNNRQDRRKLSIRYPFSAALYLARLCTSISAHFLQLNRVSAAARSSDGLLMTGHLDREPARPCPRPTLILAVLEAFRPEFTPRTWARVVTLILGTILARGRRTVAAALRQMGLHDDPDFSSYHQVFNRAAWSPRRARPPAALGRDRGLRPRGRRPDLRHRRDPGAAVGQEDPHPRPLSRPARLQQGAIGLRQRHPLDRPGPGRHRPLGEQALGPADPQPAQPDAQGQPQAGATPQDHRRAGPADDRLPPPLAARRST